MWFPSEPKVLRELNSLFEQLDSIGKRMEKWQDDLELSSRLGLSQVELLSSIQQMSRARNEAYIELSETRLGIMMGARDWRLGVPLIKPGRRVVTAMSRYLDNMDAGAEAGHAQFKKAIWKY